MGYYSMLDVMVQSSLALMLATTTFASPTSLTEYEPTHKLEARQYSNAECGSDFTTLNGLNVTTYCDQSIEKNNALSDPVKVDGFADCIEHCSRYWGRGEGCFGVVWVESDKDCWIKNSNATAPGLEPSPNHATALVDLTQMQAYNTTCPDADLSTNTLPGVSGMQYTTHCGHMINANAACFNGYPCLTDEFAWFHHAASLEECMAICVNQHPLCRSVSWNPTLEIGFANCIPKTGDDSGYTDNLDLGAGVLLFHSAVMTQIDQVDTKCPEPDTYTAAGVDSAAEAKRFEIHCGRLNPGTNITSLHTQNVTACMDACAEGDSGCKAILFDSTLTGGFNNCYLQNTTSVISDQPGATYAVLVDAVIPSSEPSSSSSGNGNDNKDSASSTSSSSSKAWIAGPVIGGLVALALLGFAIFWWRRRKAAKIGHGDKNPYTATDGAYDVVPAYTEHTGNAPQALDGDARSELPASTKYAHNYGPRSEAQELPS